MQPVHVCKCKRKSPGIKQVNGSPCYRAGLQLLSAVSKQCSGQGKQCEWLFGVDKTFPSTAAFEQRVRHCCSKNEMGRTHFQPPVSSPEVHHHLPSPFQGRQLLLPWNEGAGLGEPGAGPTSLHADLTCFCLTVLRAGLCCHGESSDTFGFPTDFLLHYQPLVLCAGLLVGMVTGATPPPTWGKNRVSQQLVTANSIFQSSFQLPSNEIPLPHLHQDDLDPLFLPSQDMQEFILHPNPACLKSSPRQVQGV